MSPSPRTPEIDTLLNTADRIERSLKSDNHRTWGFVIYRCTYESESDWDEFIRRLRYQIHASLAAHNGIDLETSLAMTVFSDQETLDDASTTEIRSKFKAWRETAVQGEQQSAPDSGEGEGEGERGTLEMGLSQRYRFCIQVDEESLDSVVRQAKAVTEPDPYSAGFVNLIKGDWEPLVLEDLEDEEEREEERMEEGDEAVEGCELRDVGWMKVAYTDVGVGMYERLREGHKWGREYRRPPEVAYA